MARKVKARQPQPPIRRRVLRNPKPSSTTVSVVKNVSDVLAAVIPHPLDPKGPHWLPIDCAGAVAEKKAAEPLYHQIETKYADWPGGAHVDIQTGVGGGFGAYVPVYYDKTATGYSFVGHLPVCTATSICTNGQKKVWQVDIKGEVNTSVEPDKMSYAYSIDVYCGGVLSCEENGTFSAERKSGTSGSIEGSFYGTQEWTRRCCPKQQALTP